MDYISERNLFRLYQLCSEDGFLIYPFSDLCYQTDKFLDFLDNAGLSYCFFWDFRKNVHDVDAFLDKFLTEYIKRYKEPAPFMEQLYTDAQFNYVEIKSIASTHVTIDWEYEKEYTQAGYFEKFIYLKVTNQEKLKTFFENYINLFAHDELVSKKDLYFKFNRQKEFVIHTFEDIYDKFGKNFVFDIYDVSQSIKQESDSVHYRLLDTLLALNYLSFLKFNHFYYTPQYKMNYEENRYEIVSYRIKTSIALTEKWFVQLDPFYKKNMYVVKADFTMVKYAGKTYSLTHNQARFTHFLYKKITDTGLDKVSYNDVLNFLKTEGFTVKSIRDLFRISASNTSPLYKTLVCFDTQHNYYLDPNFVKNVSFIPSFATI